MNLKKYYRNLMDYHPRAGLVAFTFKGKVFVVDVDKWAKGICIVFAMYFWVLSILELITHREHALFHFIVLGIIVLGMKWLYAAATWVASIIADTFAYFVMSLIRAFRSIASDMVKPHEPLDILYAKDEIETEEAPEKVDTDSCRKAIEEVIEKDGRLYYVRIIDDEQAEKISVFQRGFYERLKFDTCRFLNTNSVISLFDVCKNLMEAPDKMAFIDTIEPLTEAKEMFCIDNGQKVSKYDLYALAYNLRAMMGLNKDSMNMVMCRMFKKLFPMIITCGDASFGASIGVTRYDGSRPIPNQVVNRWDFGLQPGEDGKMATIEDHILSLGTTVEKLLN